MAEISLDADSIIESSCDELHIDDWCKEQTGTTTYYPCYKEYVMIDWSRYDG